MFSRAKAGDEIIGRLVEGDGGVKKLKLLLQEMLAHALNDLTRLRGSGPSCQHCAIVKS